tara:strand:+ start:3706 stop:5769 length:2064 start_codon:yes stop_codon:yes gene_type:complete
MEDKSKRINDERKNLESEIFPVPFSLENLKENINISTVSSSLLSKEQIMNNAIEYHSKGKILEAVKYYEMFVSLGFHDPIIFSNYGVVLKQMGKTSEAIKIYKQSIKLFPSHPGAFSNLGNLYKEMGEFEDAKKYTQLALDITPNNPEAHYNLGLINYECGDFLQAEFHTREAIKLRSNYIEAYHNLGMILFYRDQLNEAEFYALKSLKINPNYSIALSSLGTILTKLGRYEEAMIAFKKSLNNDINNSITIARLLSIFSRLLDWDEVEKYSTLYSQLGINGDSISPMLFLFLEDNPEKDLKRAINYDEKHPIKYKKAKLNKVIFQNKSKIRIGYFSSDFNNHAVSHLLIRIIELHNKSEFEIYAYSLSKKNDIYTERIKNNVFCFRNISECSDLDIVQIVREDELDIAIDLNGYTTNNRITIFKYNLAPIQINYLGYPGSTGMQNFDYILADKILIPEESKRFYSEKVLYMPNSLFPHDDKKVISSRKFRKEELGLPENGFVFTCFNSTRKISRRDFNLWMRLLKKIDNSVLWILKPSDYARDKIFLELDKYSLSHNRIIFAERMNLDEHLSRHSCGDLFLDTINYNAGTTATDCLWSGKPLITMAGKSFSSRLGASILTACNLDELITYNESEYERLAIDLATNKYNLDSICEKIKNNRHCHLFDSFKYARDLEKIYKSLIIKFK